MCRAVEMRNNTARVKFVFVKLGAQIEFHQRGDAEGRKLADGF